MTVIAPVSAGAVGGVERAQMAKDDFLQMLITQLKHQDPLNPMDGTEFTAQLAQFSSLEQLANMNVQLERMDARQAEMDRIAAVGLIGRSVLTEGNSLVADGGNLEITYRLKDDIAEGVIEICQSDGTVVDTIEMGRRGPGEYTHVWDSGRVDGGVYTFRLTAENDKGGYASWTPLMMGVVTGVSFKNDGAYLSVNGEEMALNKVTIVKQGNEK